MELHRIFCGVLAFLGAGSLLCQAGTGEFRVRAKVIPAPGGPGYYLCDGENFHPVSPEGTCDFSFSLKDGSPFVYLLTPGNVRAESPRRALSASDTELEFRIVPAPMPEDGVLRMVQGSDVQYDFLREKEMLSGGAKETAAAMAEFGAQFIVLPGDITTQGTRAQFAAVKAALDAMGVEYVPVFGGHDGLTSKPKSRFFTETFGAMYHSWNRGNIHFFAPVSELHFFTPEEKLRQNRWIQNDLALLPPGTPVVMVCHSPWQFPAKLWDNVNFTATLAAHTHVGNVAGTAKIPMLVNPSWSGSDSGFYSRRMRMLEFAPDGTLRQSTTVLKGVKKMLCGVRFGARGVLVTAYDTVEPVKEVRWSLKTASETFSGKAEKQGLMSWQFTLPENLPPGSCSIALEARGSRSAWQSELTVDLTKDAPLLWSLATGGANRDYPAVVRNGDAVFLGVAECDWPSKSGGVLAADARTGKKLWQTFLGEDVHAAPAADANFVYALTNQGTLVKIDRKDGTVLKRVRLPLSSHPAQWRIARMPLILQDGVLYCGLHVGWGKNQIFSLNPETLEEAGIPLTIGPSELYTEGFLVRNGKIIYDVSGEYGCYDPKSGKKIWSSENKAKSTFRAAACGAPLEADGKIIFPHRSFMALADAETGGLLWRREGQSFNWRKHGLARRGDWILWSYNRGIIARDLKTGKDLGGYRMPSIYGYKLWPSVWSQQIMHSSAPVVAADGAVILPGDDGRILRFPDPEKSWKNPEVLFARPVPVKGDAATDGEVLWVADFDGMLFALPLKRSGK